jgi:hypothetical protein
MNKYCVYCCYRLRWSRGSVLAFGTQVRGFKPDRTRRIFKGQKSSARLPSEGNVADLRHVKDLHNYVEVEL